MNRLACLCLVVFVPFGALAGCASPIYVDPVQPQPPLPGPADPVDPEPVSDLTRGTFDAVVIGSPMPDLPEPHRTVTVDGLTIYSWDLAEPRPEGGWVTWEVHVRDDVVVASFAI